MQGNSLIEEFHGISLDIEKKTEQKDLFAGGSDLDTFIDDLHQKQDDFFNAEHPREKKQKRDAVETAIYNIFHNELEKKKNISPQEAQEIETDLKEMTHGNKERNFFPWKLYFADVFREKGGFDVVIANPPYDVLDSTSTDSEQKLFVQWIRNNKKFKYSIQGKLNLYRLFINQSFYFMKNNGTICFIVPSTIIADKSTVGIRNLFKSKLNILFLIEFPEKSSVFESVTQATAIFLANKSNIISDFPISIGLRSNELPPIESAKVSWEDISKITGSDINIPLIKRDEEYKLLKNIHSLDCVKLGNISKMRQGDINLTVHKSFITDDKTDTLLIRGEHISRYSLDTNEINKDRRYVKKEILFDNISGRKQNEIELNYSGERIVCQNITNMGLSYRIISSICPSYHLVGHSAEFIIPNDLQLLKPILGLLNSKLINWRFKKTSTNNHVNIYELEELPISQSFINERNIITVYVDQILTAKKANPQADTSVLEREIDLLVYELYGLTEEEIAIVEESTQ